MLDFRFSEIQEEYRARLRELALTELLPRYQEGDGEVYPREQIQQVIALSNEVWRGREDERDLVAVGITAEEVARGDFNAVLPSLGPPYQDHFFEDFTPAQRETWVPDLIAGRKVVALAITEPAAGSDMGQMQARAERRGDDWVLNGVKNSVSFLNADLFHVFARTESDGGGGDGGGGGGGWEGISAFLVPRGTPGLELEPIDDLGCRAVPRGIVRLNDVRVPADAIIGEPGTAFVRISRFFDINRAVIGLKCIGAALQTLDETIEHAKKRVAFGSPLSGHQGVSFPLAEAATKLEMARWGCYRVLWMRQNGMTCHHEGAMVKWWAPKVAAEAIHQCLLFHGHYGYSRELPIQQRLRDVIGWQIGDGAQEVMKLIIARSLFSGASAERTR